MFVTQWVVLFWAHKQITTSFGFRIKPNDYDYSWVSVAIDTPSTDQVLPLGSRNIYEA